MVTIMPTTTGCLLLLLWCCLSGNIYTGCDAGSTAVLRAINCSTAGNYTLADAYATNLNLLLAALPDSTVDKDRGFFNGTAGRPGAPGTAYVLALCAADFTRADCRDCLVAAVANSSGLLSKCPGSTTVAAVYAQCLVHYSDADFLGLPYTDIVYSLGGPQNPGPQNPGEQLTMPVYRNLVDSVLPALATLNEQAANTPERFATVQTDPFALVQCTWDLPPDKCKACLDLLADPKNIWIPPIERKTYSCRLWLSYTNFTVFPLNRVALTPDAGTSPPSNNNNDKGPPSSNEKRNSNKAIIAGATTCGAVLVVVGGVVFCCCKRGGSGYKRQKAQQGEDDQGEPKSDGAEASSKEEQIYQGSLAANYRMENMDMEFDLLESIIGGSESPRHLTLPFLQFITKNFSDELKIGNGGCGVVYKGLFRNKIIAVKRLFNSRTIEDKMFHGEVKSMMMVNHKNVVRFLGYCSHTEEHALKMEGKLIMAENRERLLCFEYLVKGSLESYLADELRGLEWETRYQIIKGICDGLHHLHIDSRIIHMDLKPDNILLDSNMVPKITDFGISRLDNISQTTSTERLVSLGYCAPEYKNDGKMSSKADIYSLGVIVLVLVTGSKEEPNITKVHRRWKHRWNKTAKDAQLGHMQVATCLDLVGRCKQKEPTNRPNILDIISDLNKMDSSDVKTSDGTECMELEDMLGIEPLEIHLQFKPNKQLSCSIDLSNDTDDHFAFRVSTTSVRPYSIEANEGTVPPRSKRSVTILMQALHKALPDHQCMDEFCVKSTRVDGSLVATNILGGDIFNEQPGKVIDTVNFRVFLSEPAASPSTDD